MIGAGGVATVAAFKIVQNSDVFTEFMIASRRKQKCDQPCIALSGPYNHGCLFGLRMQLYGYRKL